MLARQYLVVFGVHVRLTESLKNHRYRHLEPLGSRPAWLRHFWGFPFLFLKKLPVIFLMIVPKELVQIRRSTGFFSSRICRMANGGDSSTTARQQHTFYANNY